MSKKLLLSIGLAVLAGCTTTPQGKGLFIPQQVITSVVETNALTQAVQTNSVTNIVFILNPGVASKLDAARQIVQSVPTPWSGIAAGVLAGVSAVLGFIAKIKSDKAALLPVVIAGVEAAGEASAPVKQSIQNLATAAGVQPRLDAVVKSLTQ